jgi:hypothetical protein
LSKKFFAICRTIEDGEKIFSYNGRDYDFTELLTVLGINKIEMFLGLLFNINGKQATLDGDKSHGFYSSSKTHMKSYVSKPHISTNVEFDEGRLRIYFKKNSLSVSIEMLYGDEVIRKFSSKEYDLAKLMEKVFSRPWDDIWLVFNIALSQRAILLTKGNNYITQMKTLIENDEYFNTTFNKFCNYSSDYKILSHLVEYVQKKIDLSSLSSTVGYENNLADCLYAFASYIISRGRSTRSKKKMKDISMDINKEVLSEL